MPPRSLQAEPLQVIPELVGCELAPPWRRAAAFAVDYVLLVIPTVIVALAAVTAAMWLQDRPALEALISLVRHHQEEPEVQHRALRDLAPLLVRLRADGLPPGLQEAVAGGELDRAAELLAERELLIAMALSASASEPAAENARDGLIRVPLERLIPLRLRGLTAYGVAEMYFALCARGRRGATLGKRLLGIRVVRLDGRPLTLWEGAERFAGYLQIPGTLGLGLRDLWRDPNRRLGHDRLVNTTVIRVRGRGKRKPRPRGKFRRKEPLPPSAG